MFCETRFFPFYIERKKWIHCFEGVDALLYVSSLSEYNQLCYEDESTQRLNESLYLFEDVCNNRWFKGMFAVGDIVESGITGLLF